MTDQPNTRKEIEFARANLSAPEAIQQATDFAIMCQKANVLVQSGLLPEAITSWQKAVAIMLRARDLDIDDWTAFQHIYVVKGNLSFDGQLCLALVQRSGLMEYYEILETTDQRCVLRLKRVGQPAFDVTCTWAEYALIAGPDGKKQQRTHLFWYTLKNGVRRLFSDVLNNMNRRRYDAPLVISEELPFDDGLDDVTEEGENDVPSTPFSLLPSASSDASSAGDDSVEVSADEAVQSDADAPSAEVPPVGALDMQSLYERAHNGKLVNNPFHFGNLLKLLLTDGTITERMSADQVLDAMRKHEAEKAFKQEILS